jgi:lipoprotein signal peptidase
VGRRVFLITLLFGLIVDLGTKTVAVGLDRGDGWLVYNSADGHLWRRTGMSLLAVAVTVVLARLAHWRGMGEIWGAWAGCGLLVAGIAGNGISRVVWSPGVPDFIHAGDRWVWNVADFSIGLGLVGGVVSIAVTGLAVYVRERASAITDAATNASRST